MNKENKYWNLENSEERLNLILTQPDFIKWLSDQYYFGNISDHKFSVILGVEPSHGQDFVFVFDKYLGKPTAVKYIE